MTERDRQRGRFIAAIALGAALAAALLFTHAAALATILAGAFFLAVFLLVRDQKARIDELTAAAERRAARAERAPLRAKITEGIREPLLLLDPGRRVREANRAAHTLFGTRIVGHDIALHLRHPAVLDAIAQAIAGAPTASCEITLPDAVERVYAVSVSRVANAPAGEGTDSRAQAAPPFFIVVFLHEITQMKHAEEMRADFIANVSHELRTPLAALLGFIETLRGPAKGDAAAQERFLAIMEDEAQRMTRLIDDLLSLSRIERDAHLRPAGRVDLAALCETVAQGLEVVAQERRMRIVPELASDLPPVRGDRDQIMQLVQNLLANALKYATAGTPVTLAARATDERPAQVRLEVRDEGPGIAPEHLPRLTERFYRVDPARSRKVGGTGLGLAIVKHIVARHGGRLEIESAPGEGTTVRVTLPAAPSP